MTIAIYERLSGTQEDQVRHAALEVWAHEQQEDVTWYQDAKDPSLTVNTLHDLHLHLKYGQIKTLAFWSFDQWDRQVVSLGRWFELLTASDIRIVELEHDIDSFTEQGKVFFENFAIAAECEHRVRARNISVGLKAVNAKRKEKAFGGRKKGEPIKVTPEMKERIIKSFAAGRTITQLAKQEDLTRTTVYKLLTEAGF